jgi:hypothetical protein
LTGSVLAVLLVLALIGDDRHVGLVADGRQMIRTAVAIVETGEIGQARGRDFTFERPEHGDAVSRFGMAMSLLHVPAAIAAPAVEARVGAAGSQALFLFVPWLAVGIAAAAAGMLARRLGGGDVETVAAVLLASIASPVASYAAMEFSEPVQAAALTSALMLAFTAANASTPRPVLELIAGFAAGLAVLSKSSLIVAAPAVLLPLIDWSAPRRTRLALIRAGLGAAGPLALWAIFEFARFGRLFGGYPDDRFTHPWFDGFWRLLIGPNRGLLLFWPALVLFVWIGLRWRRAWLSSSAGRAWLGAAWVLAAQLAIAAGYWGWHGMEGWGPRLILAAVPLLAPFAAIALGGERTRLLIAIVIASVVINLMPLLQHPTPMATYVANLPWPEIPDADAPRYPFYATSRSAFGRPTVVPFEALELEPAANPWRVYWWFWQTTRLDGEALSKALTQPPWADVRRDLVPPAWPPDAARQVAPPPRFGFLGRSLTGTGGPYATTYLDALLDQVVRANQQGVIDRALALSERRLQLQADGEAVAWRLESLRRAGRAIDAEQLLRSLPETTRSHPLINVVLALFDRDGGEEQRARALLGSVANSFPNAPLHSALASPLDRWPADLDAMTRVPRRDATVASLPQ